MLIAAWCRLFLERVEGAVEVAALRAGEELAALHVEMRHHQREIFLHAIAVQHRNLDIANELRDMQRLARGRLVARTNKQCGKFAESVLMEGDPGKHLSLGRH